MTMTMTCGCLAWGERKERDAGWRMKMRGSDGKGAAG